MWSSSPITKKKRQDQEANIKYFKLLSSVSPAAWAKHASDEFSRDSKFFVIAQLCEESSIESKNIQRVYIQCIENFNDSDLAFSIGWVMNHSTSKCLCCGLTFSMTRRRHHCRSCGDAVCSDCSQGRRFVPEYDLLSKLRVCSNCEREGDEHKNTKLFGTWGKMKWQRKLSNSNNLALKPSADISITSMTSNSHGNQLESNHKTVTFKNDDEIIVVAEEKDSEGEELVLSPEGEEDAVLPEGKEEKLPLSTPNTPNSSSSMEQTADIPLDEKVSTVEEEPSSSAIETTESSNNTIDNISVVNAENNTLIDTSLSLKQTSNDTEEDFRNIDNIYPFKSVDTNIDDSASIHDDKSDVSDLSHTQEALQPLDTQPMDDKTTDDTSTDKSDVKKNLFPNPAVAAAIKIRSKSLKFGNGIKSMVSNLKRNSISTSTLIHKRNYDNNAISPSDLSSSSGDGERFNGGGDVLVSSLLTSEDTLAEGISELLQQAGENGEVLIDWQIQLFGSNSLGSEEVPAGFYVVLNTRKNTMRKTEFNIKPCGADGEELSGGNKWVRLKRGDGRNGRDFKPIRKILVNGSQDN